MRWIFDTKELEALVADRGALRLEWAVLDWNEGAIRLYERLGARRHDEWLRYSLEEAEMKRLAELAIS